MRGLPRQRDARGHRENETGTKSQNKGSAPDPRYLESDTYTLVCQVNGKVRDRVDASASATEEELAALCRAAPNVQVHVDGKQVVKEVVVPGKLVNVVVR